MNKMMISLLMLTALLFAQQGGQQAEIEEALMELQQTTQSLMAMGVVLSLILALPLILAGAFLFVTKKENKTLKLAGIALIVIGIGLPILLGIIYLLVPFIIAALMG